MPATRIPCLSMTALFAYLGLACVPWIVCFLPTQVAAERETSTVEIPREHIDFFETNIRPIFVEHCYGCHSAEAKIVQGDLRLDSRQGVATGGESGEVITGNDPEQSRLIEAVRWSDDIQMPPDDKLTGRQIEALEHWVRLGAPDPRESPANSDVQTQGIDIDAGREWWAFQPVRVQSVRASDNDDVASAWIRTKVDRFIFAKLRESHLTPSPPADRATLIHRIYLDLIGLRPTYSEVQSFVSNDSPDAYERVVDQLLASLRYGERWGRYWMDVVRYGETQFTGEATTPPFPYAWRYRDWIIDAINNDTPYDHFVKLQLAADLMPETSRADLVALGFLGTSPGYHKDGRLSEDVVETLYTDDWDERLDTVTRGFLGLTVACARCHDHKFDPIPTSDYYSLAGVFASTVQGLRPLADIDAVAETKYMVDSQQIFYLSYVARLLRDDPGSKPVEARQKVKRYSAEMQQLKDENAGLQSEHPDMYKVMSRLARMPQPYPDEPQPVRSDDDENRNRRRGRRRGGATEPLFHSVYDAGFWVDGSDPDLTMFEIRPDELRNMHVLAGGNVTRPGDVAPRGFLTVLAKDDPTFHSGSGRRELAEMIFNDAAALSARVMVNRVWAWHFGKPIVGTPSDFGVQGEAPSHPLLLDDLAARFIDNGYSLKWLHREIVLSAAYQQASQPRSDAMSLDPTNQLLGRMNPRRLDIEAFRDTLLQAAGSLDLQMSGPSSNLDDPRNRRRTVYGSIRRSGLSSILQLYDFPEATMHSPQRNTTTSPLQQLFVMNSEFVQGRAEELAGKFAGAPSVRATIQAMYRGVLARDADEHEIKWGERFLEASSVKEFAQALLATNEVIFWP